jgi:uncharacterized iron-regulated membrane protein
MRLIFTLLHRYVGLLIATFLVFSGLTGAVISWDHELDDLLNPHLTKVHSTGQQLSSLNIAKQIEAKYSEVRVTYLPIGIEHGDSLAFILSPKLNPATNRLFEPGLNQIFIDPVTGKELGKREGGAVWPVTQENFVSFLYKLHYSLHFPEMLGTDH